MIDAKKTAKGQEQRAKAVTDKATKDRREQHKDKKFKSLSAKQKDHLLKMLAVSAGLVQDDDES